jgi:hypothetical protein
MVSCFVCDPTHEDLMTKLVHFMLVLDLLVLTHGLPSKCHSGVSLQSHRYVSSSGCRELSFLPVFCKSLLIRF